MIKGSSYILSLVFIASALNMQAQYFEKSYDFDGKGIGDRLSTFTIDGDTLYVMAHHLCDSLQLCISLIKMDYDGEVICIKSIDFLDRERNPIIEVV